MISPSGAQIEIEHGAQRVVVVEVGAGLRSYTLAGQHVVDGYGGDEMSTAGRGQVLIPWPNRVQDGSYEFDGRAHQLPLTEPEHSNAIHGLVRWSAWTVGERESHRVVLDHLLRPQPGYPFSLELSVAYELSENGLRVTTTATNVGADPCPYGSGAHPYLTIGDTNVDPLMLSVPAGTVLQSDERGLPVGSAAVEGTEYDFRRSRPIGATKLDNAFTGLQRDARGIAHVELEDPESGAVVALWVDESYPYVMLFTGDRPDVSRGGLAVEPMTCPPNSFRTGQDLIRLEPGASVTSTWGISAKIDGGAAIPLPGPA